MEEKYSSEELHRQWETTRISWRQMFGTAMETTHYQVPVCVPNFISKEFASNVLHLLPHQGTVKAVKDRCKSSLKTSVLLDASFREDVRSAMFTTKGEVAGNDMEEQETTEPMPAPVPVSVPVPVRIKQGPARAHQDRYDGGDQIIDAYVAMVYVKGNGTIQFIDVNDGTLHDLPVEPLSLIFFDNSKFTHQVIPGDTKTRVMLGPFTFAGKELVRAGDCGGCSGCSSSDSSSDSTPYVWGVSEWDDYGTIFCWGCFTCGIGCKFKR